MISIGKQHVLVSDESALVVYQLVFQAGKHIKDAKPLSTQCRHQGNPKAEGILFCQCVLITLELFLVMAVMRTYIRRQEWLEARATASRISPNAFDMANNMMWLC